LPMVHSCDVVGFLVLEVLAGVQRAQLEVLLTIFAEAALNQPTFVEGIAFAVHSQRVE